MNKNNKAVSAKETNQDIIDLLNKRLDAIEEKIEVFGAASKLRTARAARFLEIIVEENHRIAMSNHKDLVRRTCKASDLIEDFQGRLVADLIAKITAKA